MSFTNDPKVDARAGARTARGFGVGQTFGLFFFAVVSCCTIVVWNAIDDIMFSRQEMIGNERLEVVWDAWTNGPCCSIKDGDRWAAEYGIEPEYRAFVAAPEGFVRDQAAVELMESMADKSNLTLDPELPTFYLMRFTSLNLPRLVAAQRELSAEIAASRANPKERDTVFKTRLFEASAQQAIGHFDRVNRYAGSWRTEEVIAPEIAILRAGVRKELARIRSAARGAENSNLDSSQFYAAVDRSWHAASEELDRLIKARINGKIITLVAELAFLLGILAIGYQAWEKTRRNEVELLAARRTLEQANDELENERDRLEQRVLERTAELEIASDEALRANAAKSQFLATMSHELRTPLHSIVSYGELLKEGAEEEGRASDIEDLDVILRASSHLLALISQLLDMAKVEAGKMDIDVQSFDLGQSLADITKTMRPVVEKNGNTFKVTARGLLGEVCTDRGKMSQCVLNLLSNAAKFTQNGVVTLTVDVAVRSGKPWIDISVADTGIGMSEESLAKLFQPFTQAEEDTARRFGGTGLGLSISKNFAELLGGTLTATSIEGKGTTFKLSVPGRLQPKAGASAAHSNVDHVADRAIHAAA